ncbi:MAG: hypothetical protein LRY76_08960 [Alphaproteobacteria bacterium]|nr:hypothetical protein [Alphaproteobacteria bacterium]MCD8571623.1 hypothetical protein [Alphaproteobacteria bacterium]
MNIRTATYFGTAAALAASAALSTAFFLKAPENKTPGTPFPFDASVICTASREDIPALIAGLPAPPFMSLDVVRTVLTKQKTPPILMRGVGEWEGMFILQWQDEQGRPHREGAPAQIVFDPVRKRVVMETWARNGLLHREGGEIASTEWDSEGRIITQIRAENGKKNNTAEPSFLRYDWENDLLIRQWFLQDKQQRPGMGPDYTKTHISTGVVVYEEWAQDRGGAHVVHRYDGLYKLEHDPHTRFQTHRHYRLHGMENRTDIIDYEIWNDPKTGLMRREEWRKNDQVMGYVEYDSAGIPTTQSPDTGAIDRLRQNIKELQKTGGGHHNHHDHHMPAPANP